MKKTPNLSVLQYYLHKKELLEDEAPFYSLESGTVRPGVENYDKLVAGITYLGEWLTFEVLDNPSKTQKCNKFLWNT